MLKVENQIFKLFVLKLIHTFIWLIFAVAIFYVLFSGIFNIVNTLTWACIGLVIGEGIVLIIFKMFCPLTLLAKKYSNSDKDNFDIFLPNWLARHNKLIFTAIFIISLLIVLFRMIVKIL